MEVPFEMKSYFEGGQRANFQKCLDGNPRGEFQELLFAWVGGPQGYPPGRKGKGKGRGAYLSGSGSQI